LYGAIKKGGLSRLFSCRTQSSKDTDHRLKKLLDGIICLRGGTMRKDGRRNG
jgi:hypothetical protein